MGVGGCGGVPGVADRFISRSVVGAGWVCVCVAVVVCVWGGGHGAGWVEGGLTILCWGARRDDSWWGKHPAALLGLDGGSITSCQEARPSPGLGRYFRATV